MLLHGFFPLTAHRQMVWQEINLCGFYCVTTCPVVTAAGNTTCLEKGIIKLFLHLSQSPLVIFHSDVSAVETVLGLTRCYLTLLYESIKLMVSDQPLEDAHKAETNWEIIGLIKLPQELHKSAPTGQVQRHKLQTTKQTVNTTQRKKKCHSQEHVWICFFFKYIYTCIYILSVV